MLDVIAKLEGAIGFHGLKTRGRLGDRDDDDANIQ